MTDRSLATELRYVQFLLLVLVTLVAIDVAGLFVGVGVTALVTLLLALDAT